MRHLAISCIFVIGCSSTSGHKNGATDMNGAAADMNGATADMNGAAADMNGATADMNGAAPDLMASGPVPWRFPPFYAAVAIDNINSHTLAEAQFGTRESEQSGPCFTETIGACMILDCPGHDGSGFFGPPLTLVGAGTIRVSGFGTPFVVPLSMNSIDWQYETSKPAVWSGGETITITTTGDSVPPFSVSVRAPSPPAPTAMLSSVPITVTRANGFTFTWASGPVGDAELDLYPTGADPNYKSAPIVQCFAPADKGTMTVPTEVLARLPTLVYANMETMTQMTKVVGQWPINVRATATLNDSMGNPWGPTLTLQ